MNVKLRKFAIILAGGLGVTAMAAAAVTLKGYILFDVGYDVGYRAGVADMRELGFKVSPEEPDEKQFEHVAPPVDGASTPMTQGDNKGDDGRGGAYGGGR